MYRVQQRRGKVEVPTVVSVPEKGEPPSAALVPDSEGLTQAPTRHTEIQYHLLRLGVDMGLDIWVAKNDRSKIWNGQVLGRMPRMLEELPTQFNEATNRTIELIDVLWLRGTADVGYGEDSEKSQHPRIAGHRCAYLGEYVIHSPKVLARRGPLSIGRGRRCRGLSTRGFDPGQLSRAWSDDRRHPWSASCGAAQSCST